MIFMVYLVAEDLVAYGSFESHGKPAKILETRRGRDKPVYHRGWIFLCHHKQSEARLVKVESAIPTTTAPMVSEPGTFWLSVNPTTGDSQGKFDKFGQHVSPGDQE
jgi:hypothetical protein